MIDGGAVKVPVLSQVWPRSETFAHELISASLGLTPIAKRKMAQTEPNWSAMNAART
jgi:hypothetical protein